jgi:tetratricopeptide (TPR) repeat protein
MSMANSDYYIMDNSDIENKKLDAAKSLYQQGDYSAALKLYLDMVNTSYSYKLYYEIGRCYYKLNDIVRAESYFSQSVSLEEFKNPALVFLGNIFYKRGEASKAIEYWMTYYSYKPDDESVCLNLATSYFSKDMRFQAISFYEKYLRYAKDKESTYYLEIKKIVQEFKKIGVEFYQNALKAIQSQDRTTAVQALQYSLKNYPLSFDANSLLGRLLFEDKQYMQASAYLKLAYCIDSKSFDTLDKLSSTLIIIGDYTSAYCSLKRTLPLVIKNQKEYLEIMKTINSLEKGFDKYSFQGHLEWAEKYYKDNNYQLALLEYENCRLINPADTNSLDEKIQKLRMFLKPEERIIKSCFEKGGAYYSDGEYKLSNKYFTKIMKLAIEDSTEYKFAKSRLVNV